MAKANYILVGVMVLDMDQMPDFNTKVKNGTKSVSGGKITWTKENKVTCVDHGACLCVSEDRSIWRCATCNEGAYVIWGPGYGSKVSGYTVVNEW